MSSDSGNLDRRLEFIVEHLAQFNATLDRLAERDKKYDERLDRLSDKVDGLTDKVDQIATGLYQLGGRVDQLASTVDALTAVAGTALDVSTQTGETVTRLVAGIGTLVEAQQRTDARFGELAEQRARDGALVDARLDRVASLLERHIADRPSHARPQPEDES